MKAFNTDYSEYFQIRLNNLRFFSHIGVSEQERKVGNEFSVNITILYSAEKFIHEDLSSTISYADVYDLVDREMKKEALLLETVAKHITLNISNQWQECVEIETEICKIHPPITGIIGNCAVKYFYKKK